MTPGMTRKNVNIADTVENQDGGDLMKELESLKLKFDAMERENDKLEKEKKELRSEVDDLEEKLKHLQIKLSADDEIIEEMKQQILDYHTRIAESEDNCDNSRSRNIELEKEMSGSSRADGRVGK